jgi:hypothetical protein
VASHPTELNVTEARQGETGHGVRYVLGYGLALALLAMVFMLAFAH